MRKPFYLGMNTEVLNRLADLVYCIRDFQLGDYSPLMDEIFDAEDAIRLSVSLNPSARWLLLYMLEKHPQPLAETTPLTYPAHIAKPNKGDMNTLVRRGWVNRMTGINGLYELTHAGHCVASCLKSSSAERTPSETLVRKRYEQI